ncbi:hypothetical protein [Formosa sp. A9]|uniref:hypothetical protein n=1 Tax=Formosa sp. A9 TaxID=3442641 RepID=UPI003EBF35FD
MLLPNKRIPLMLLFAVSFVVAQEGLNFTVNKQFYLKGNSVLIGNNIVSNHALEPFNDRSVFNDKIKLEYIDVDEDKSTFSSSQAVLTLPPTSKKIVYAALYWSAIYKYDKGVKRTLGDQIVYKGNDERSLDVHKILFKLPNNDYEDLKGIKIYDSYNNAQFNDTKPYVCYADVTQLLQNASTVNGNYTVANIRATEGFVSGGASGGWLLHVIYEDDSAKPKYFTTYNGFTEVNKEAVDITFKDFRTDEQAEIKTALSLGVLEGDQKFKTDACYVMHQDSESFTPLSNTLREDSNFFNSTITIGDKYFKDRTPNSINTLGFDLLKTDIPNPNNMVLSNNSTEMTIRFKTKADRFYVFFVAFETEISPILLESKDENLFMTTDTKTYALPQQKDLDKITALKSLSIPGLEKGYYLVTNVFSVEANATKWKAFLAEKGHTPKSYKNPKNNWDYIYLDMSEDPNDVYLKQRELSKLDYFSDVWILKINM